MSKVDEINNQTHRVRRIEDVLPSNSAEAAHFIECPDDNVDLNWWIDEETDTLHEEKIWTLEEVRPLRNEKLFNTVKISFVTIEWDNELDLDPEILYSEAYDKSREKNKSILAVI